MKQKHLEWFLSDLESFQKPKLYLEQYATNPELGSAILNAVDDDGFLDDCMVADLGCGCGNLMLGAASLQALYCLGLEIDDDALSICKRNILQSDFTEVVEVLKLDVIHDILALRGTTFDTVIMNPPFGTKKNAGIDMKFVEAGLSLLRDGGHLYSLHKSSTRNFILKNAKGWGTVVAECIAEMRWNLPATYKHHKQTSVDIDVDLFCFQK